MLSNMSQVVYLCVYILKTYWLLVIIKLNCSKHVVYYYVKGSKIAFWDLYFGELMV